MASKSDGKVGPGITFSSMKQPPLIKQLKGILSEYPDGGQILKEILQNAEDAEASEVKILFDGRQINNKICDTSQDYDRFFKGPALCIYNDGVFTEKDWDGIRMIYSSVKEDDPLTVGRFGLGFKSVFHITDFPCVISGSKMLFIDPQRPANEVNAMIDLNRIDHVDDEGLNANAFWSAFDRTFGFSRECTKAGYFSGSIFRFPLREVASEISDTLYDEAKIMDLFDGFQSEASSILLFLKNLCRISVSVFDSEDQMKTIAVAEIEDSSGRLKQSRSKFKEKIKILSSDYKGEDISVDLHVTIRTTINNACETAQWQVINYFVGNSASQQFKKLIQDKRLGYSPYVGVAAPLSPSVNTLEGHVFCFLPLPREGSRLTGLPVHVNGFFALSQNRHHLKWATDEQKGKKIDDKCILWNKFLINEALPKAYGRLVQDIVEVSNKLGNTDESVKVVYNSLPLASNVQSKWKDFEAELYKRIRKLKIMYSESKGTWVTVSDACFASFDKLPGAFTSTSASVIQCLKLLGKNHVALPLNVFNNLKRHFKSVRDLCPESLAQILCQNATYKQLSNEDKINLLTYLFSDERCYEKVEGLELLPLESGRWTNFKARQDPIFICLEEETYILQGLEDILVRTKSSIGNHLSSHIENISAKGLFQVRKMELPVLVQLLETTIKKQLGTSLCLTQQTKLSFKWLQAVWSFIMERNCVQEFRNVHIVPVLTKGTWEQPEALKLETLNDTLLIKSSMKDTLPEGVCNCFENLGIRVLSSLPDWIPKEKVKSHFYWPTQKSFVGLLSKLGSDCLAKENAEIFNKTCKPPDKSAFAACITTCTHILTDKAAEFVKSLQLFVAISSVKDEGTLSSVSETSCYIKEKEFPEGVQFPFSCLDANSSNETLLVHLGASKIDYQELVLKTLKGFQNKGFQNLNEVLKFMDFFINKFHLFQSNQNIIDSASDIPFLKANSNRHKAKDLFDPSDNLLKDLLFGDALLPETKKPLGGEKIRILKFLGLKSSEDITADIVLQVAKSLDCWPEENKDSVQCLRKADALIKLLHSKHFLLDEKCYTGMTLANSLRTLSCIPVERNRVAIYPSCVSWYSEKVTLCKPVNAKEKSLGCLVGAVVPIVSSTSARLNAKFEWTKQPSISDVISQLKVVKDSYSVQYRPDIMPLIKAIYSELSKRNREVWQQSGAFSDEKLIWNGENFVSAKKVMVLKEPGDLELQPYFTFLPAEFTNMQDLFSAFGCPLKQDIHILVEALKLIKECHKTVQDVQSVTRDRINVCNILEKIAEMVSVAQLSIEDLDIQMMVHDDSLSNSICLFPISECVYDDDLAFYFEKDENVHLVHEMVSQNIVKALGIKSVTRKALLDAEELGVEAWGQQEPLTTRINTLLREGYTDGLSVPKELIQNADDAGASTVKFLYDERENMEFRRRVFSKEMKAFQGPALWIFNDAEFSVDDLKNITKLNAATKQTDMRKIGKFGLGFCSVYNLTDVPSFLSGSSLVFFDPHQKYLHHKKTGLKYQLPNKTLVCRHIDQFKPYAGIFGCFIDDDEFERFDGTLFRLPLRTEKQAKESLVCSVPYTKEEMSSLFRMFIETAGNCLLFTQNIKQIELYHLSGTATEVSEKKMIFRIHRECVSLDKGIHVPIDISVLSRIPEILEKQKDLSEIHKSVIRQEHTDHLKQIIGDIDNVKNDETVWLTSWAKGNKKSLKMYKQLAAEGAVPLAAVSVPCTESNVLKVIDLQNIPCGFYSEGHIFCFLPLPLKTQLQIQVNGCFSVTSDRRHLVSLTEDDKNSRGKQWNDALMEDALVRAHCQLIKMFAFLNRNTKDDYQYFELWPRDCAAVLLPFKRSFYRAIIKNNMEVFCGNNALLTFNDVVFLDPKIRGTVIGALAYEFLSHFPPRQGKTLFEMPEYIFENILENNREKEKSIRSALISEKELFLTFLQSLHTDFWDCRIEDRNLLILAALKCQCSDVREKMQAVRCIPTEPNNALSRASDLIHPDSSIASLFCEKDEIFPLNSKDFRKVSILAKLVQLGMNETFIPKGRLLERCKSVSTLAETCDICSQERCDNLLRYISQDHVLEELFKDSRILRQISDLYILPVMSKPTDWRFSWKAESDSSQVKSYRGEIKCGKHQGLTKRYLIGKPRQLFRSSMKDYIGIVGLIVDEYRALSVRETAKNASKVFSLLGVKCIDETSVEILVKQLELLSKEYKHKESQYEDVSRIHEKVLLYLEKKLKSPEITKEETNALESLRCHSSVLIGDELVKAQRVAFYVKEEYRPKLYRLPEKDKRNKYAIYSYLGVKEYFDVEDIIAAMKTVKKKENETNLIESVNCLLINLFDVMQKSGKSYEDLAEFHDYIIAPDIHCKLWPTYQLVVENKDFLASISMKILHQSVAPLLAEHLGVKVKRLCCYKEISVGISFGQREELVTRIKGLLKAYPCDSSIMKELLQNADDAGATEIHFVKDYRTHSKAKLFQSSCEPLQGPALCVYNNSFFTKKDIEGIHDLGKGSKCDDPTKTGQYGVGFNAVYHLTDTPSFVTIGPDEVNESLMFILDPLCTHVPLATVGEPGMMCRLQDLESNFSDHITGFSLEELVDSNVGTVFRFPLRSTSSMISSEEISTTKMDDILLSFQNDMFECVLFLKNISCIRVSNISSGKLEEEYTVMVELSEQDEKVRKSFNETVNDITRQNMDNRANNLESNPCEAIYRLTVTDNKKCSKQWLIIQRFGVNEYVSQLDEIKQYLNSGDIGLLPLGGIALPISDRLVRAIAETNDQNGTNISEDIAASQETSKERNMFKHETELMQTKTLNGKLFCFLPLPVVTGLPVHVNGHFALDHEARRDLWKDGYRHEWNTFIVNGVVILAWISGLLHLQTSITPVIRRAKTWRSVNLTMQEFYSNFPNQNCTSDFWNCTTNFFYKYIVNESVPVFSFVQGIKCDDTVQKSLKRKFDASWTVVSPSPNGIFYGIFNTVIDEMRDCRSVTQKDTREIIKLLKTFGMKLLETPNKIRLSMEKAGIEGILTSSPSQVIFFMKSCVEGNVSQCTIGPIGSNISNTKYDSSSTLVVLLKYITLDRDLHKKLEGLPILLTADDKLRICSQNEPVFVSEYSPLLPKNAMMFVHEDIRHYFQLSTFLESIVFKNFKFDDFVGLLPNSVNIEIYSRELPIGLDEEERECKEITENWLATFYDFLFENSCRSSQADSKYSTGCGVVQKTYNQIDIELLSQNIGKLEKWSFLPCKRNHIQSLIPFAETRHVLFLSYLDTLDGVGKSLEQFNLPSLYVKAFSKCKRKTEVRTAMENIVASVNRPYDLLRCLVYHKHTLEITSITENDSTEILGFFCRNLKVLESYERKCTLVGYLRQLPLYLTQHGTFTNIADVDDVLVLPKGMPNGGIQAWANTCKITLLQEKESLEAIYQFLGLQKADVQYVYGQKILPTFFAIPNQHWMDHIKFLRDKLGHISCLNSEQLKIVNELKKIAFINVSGVLKRPNELFDPSNAVFECMIDSCNSLPCELLTQEWKPFLMKLGLICNVTDALMLQFARQIEAEISITQRERIHKRSKVLLERFCSDLGRLWQSTTISQIRTIKFITPFVTDKDKTDICKQYDESGALICFQDATSSSHSKLCWSSIHLLEKQLCQMLDTVVRKRLGIHEDPPLDRVVIHFENVCRSLKPMLCSFKTSDCFVKNQMSCFYEYFSNYKTLNKEVIERIQKTPFLHLPDEMDIVSASEVVIDLPQSQEIKPYLYRAPTYYGKYFDLFCSFGCKSNALFCHFASVLIRMKNSCQNNKMSVPERNIAKKAFIGLMSLKADSDESTAEIESIWLPTRNMTLRDSREVIVSNEVLFEMRLKGLIELPLCAGLSFHGIRDETVQECFLKWPRHLRPTFLIDVVKEEVCLEESYVHGDKGSLKALTIERFLHSNELTIALCRLIKHQTSYGNSQMFDGERTENEIRDNLRNVEVVELPALRTVLKYRGNVVPGSEKEIDYHIKESNGSNSMSFFFNGNRHTGKLNIPSIHYGMIRLLTLCASSLNADSIIHVTLLIQELEIPHRLNLVLDRLHIKAYGSPQEMQTDYFPKPGTYVEPQFIPFLVQGISPFKKHEYEHIAMELEDSSLETEEDGLQSPVFIYVRILEEVSSSATETGDLNRIYRVETGNKNVSNELVQIYRLYRFVRKETNTCNEMELFTGEQTNNQIPVDEQCRKVREEIIQAWRLPEKERKRIVRRIILEWHPDKNRGNEEYCTKVFQYIQIILSRLENGEIIVDDVNEEMSRGRSEFSQSSSSFYENVFRRARTYARAYYDNFEAYNRSERTGSYAHSTASRNKRPDYGEAQRWFQQSKHDFLAATEMFPTANVVSAFNWVCYICHQACEKALKSVHYSVDANNVPGDIYLPALAITPEMREQAVLLETRLGQHGRLTYPDSSSRPRIPSNMYDKDDAEFSLAVTRRILELVEAHL